MSEQTPVVRARRLYEYHCPKCEALIQVRTVIPPFEEDCPSCDKTFLVEAGEDA